MTICALVFIIGLLIGAIIGIVGVMVFAINAARQRRDYTRYQRDETERKGSGTE